MSGGCGEVMMCEGVVKGWSATVKCEVVVERCGVAMKFWDAVGGWSAALNCESAVESWS